MAKLKESAAENICVIRIAAYPQQRNRRKYQLAAKA